MKDFDILKAREGQEVVTKDNKDVKILLFDRSNAKFPLVAIIENKDVHYYTNEGRFYANKESEKDLKIK